MNVHWYEQIQRYMAGRSTPEEIAALQQSLKDEAGLRVLYLDCLNLDEALAAAANIVTTLPKQPASIPSIRHGVPLVQRWALVAAACIFLALGAWWSQSGSEGLRGECADFSGTVEVLRAGQRMTVKGAFMVREGDELNLSDGTGVATLRFRDEATQFFVHGGSRLILHRLRDGKEIELHHGVLGAGVARQPAGRPMLLRTPQATATVLGTEFELAVQSWITGLKVINGLVNLTAPDESSVEVRAGGNAIALQGEPVREVKYDAVWQASSTPEPQITLAHGEGRRFTFDRNLELWNLTSSKWAGEDTSIDSVAGKPATGVLDLRGDAYLQVSGPTFLASSGDRFTVGLRARFEAESLFRARFYAFHDTIVNGKAESSVVAFPVIPVPTPDGHGGFQQLRFSFTLPEGNPPVTSISLILYKLHADGTAPQPGDRIVIDEITMRRDH